MKHEYGRRLLPHRVYAAPLIFVLAIGIGGFTGVFALYSRTLLHPLPVEGSERLVSIGGAARPPSGDVVEWWGRAKAIEDLSEYSVHEISAVANGSAERVVATVASSNFSRLLRLRLQLGRWLTPEEELPGHAVAILSDRAFDRWFHRSPNVLGQSILLNGKSHTVIGVLAPGGWAPGSPSVYAGRIVRGLPSIGIAPYASRIPLQARSGLVGRLRSGVSLTVANDQLHALLRELSALTPKTGVHYGDLITIAYWQDRIIGAGKNVLSVFLIVALLVLLISLANGGGLILARVASRRTELTMRRILGAGSAHLWWLLFRDSYKIAALSSLIGLGGGLAFAEVLPLDRLLRFAAVTNDQIDGVVIATVGIVAILAATLLATLSFLPAIRLKLRSITAGGHAPVAHGMKNRGRTLFVIVQLALLLPLLVYSLQTIKTYRRTTTAARGYSGKGVSVAFVVLQELGSNTPQDRAEVFARIRRRIAEAGLSSGIIDALPLGGPSAKYVSVVAGGRPVMAARLLIDGEYFRTLRMNRISAISGEDGAGELQTRDVVVSRSLAQELWHFENVAGEMLRLEGEDTPRRVAGVVEDVYPPSLKRQPALQVYLSFRWPYRNVVDTAECALVLRSDNVARAASIARSSVKDAASHAYITRVAEFDDAIAEAVAEPRIRAGLMTGCAVLATFLAVLGLYGAVACTLEARRTEFGLRLAFGATVWILVRQILRESCLIGTAGAMLGIAMTIVSGRLLQSIIVDFDPYDYFSVTLSTGLLMAVVVVTALISTLRLRSVLPSNLLHTH